MRDLLFRGSFCEEKLSIWNSILSIRAVRCRMGNPKPAGSLHAACCRPGLQMARAGLRGDSDPQAPLRRGDVPIYFLGEADLDDPAFAPAAGGGLLGP